jgi:hypothetical protein
MKELIVAASVLVSVASMGAQDIAPADIAAAVEQGRAGKTLQKKCGAYGINGFDIVAEGPIGRIMRAAREAKRQHWEFTAADVTPALLRPVLTVGVRRDPTLAESRYTVPLNGAKGYGVLPAEILPYMSESPDYSFSHFPGVTYGSAFVLRSKPSGAEKQTLLKPVGPVFYGHEDNGSFMTTKGHKLPPNLGPWPSSDMTASFDLEAFRALPPGGVEIVVFMTDSGERRCKISEKDRRALR